MSAYHATALPPVCLARQVQQVVRVAAAVPQAQQVQQVVQVAAIVPQAGAGLAAAVAPDGALAGAKALAQLMSSAPDQRVSAYLSYLEVIAQAGALGDLRPDALGALRVNVPFCHDFFEASLLIPFLLQRLGPRSDVKRLAVFGCDLHPQPFWWPAWHAWAQDTYGTRVQLELRQQDLERGPQPPGAALSIGAHPEVTNGGPWLRIIEHVLLSRAEGGRCIFATFYRNEAEATLQVCQGFGATGEIFENPFYAGQPDPTIGTFFRYAVVLAPAASLGAAAPAAASSAHAHAPLVVQPRTLQAAVAPTSAVYLPSRIVPLQAQPAAAAAAVTLPPRSDRLEATIRWAQRRIASPQARDFAYDAFFKALAEWRVLGYSLPADPSGSLRVSVPFCSQFQEVPFLMPFLVSQLLDRGVAQELSIFGCDVEAQPYWWQAWQEWAAHTFGAKVKVQLVEQDLAKQPPPAASLILAIHPEVTRGGIWNDIVRHVFESCLPGGRCIFATFYMMEAQSLATLAKAMGAICEVRENPFYVGRPQDEVGTYLRYIVMMRREE